MQNAESKMWNRKCRMTLIGRGVKPRDRCHFVDYHYLNRQCGIMQKSSAENASNDGRIRFLTMNSIYNI